MRTYENEIDTTLPSIFIGINWQLKSPSVTHELANVQSVVRIDMKQISKGGLN